MKELRFQVGPVIVVNEGASFGPRVATATFSVGRWTRPEHSITVIIDVDGERYQDESGVRRRAGRAAVPVARRAATAVGGAELQPTIGFGSIDRTWGRATWLYREEFEGLPRVVRASADFRATSEKLEDLVAAPETTETIARALRSLANDLHVSIDDPAHWAVFGGR